MNHTRIRSAFTHCLALALAALLCASPAGADNTRPASQSTATPLQHIGLPDLARQLEVGDVIFIRVPALPFRHVALASGSWTNHVGIVIDVSGEEPLIAESTFPLSRTGTLSRFVARSEGGRVAIRRLNTPLGTQQQDDIRKSALRRTGILYDTGFDLHSSRQFCSRYVREVVEEATRISLGEVQTFSGLLAAQPGVDLQFWRIWYMGRIPWERATVTPASILHSPHLHPVIDGLAARAGASARSGS